MLTTLAIVAIALVLMTPTSRAAARSPEAGGSTGDPNRRSPANDPGQWAGAAFGAAFGWSLYGADQLRDVARETAVGRATEAAAGTQYTRAVDAAAEARDTATDLGHSADQWAAQQVLGFLVPGVAGSSDDNQEPQRRPQ